MRWLFLVLSLFPAMAADNPHVAQGFDHFYNLEYDEAIESFQKAVAASPGEPDYLNHLAQSVLYKAMFRAGALESELVSGNNPFVSRNRVATDSAEQRIFDESINKSLALSQAAKAKNPRDVHAIYAEGVAFGIRSNYNFLVRKAWRDSLKDATTARSLHNRISEIEPGNVDARLVQGLHDYIVGSLPFTYKVLGFLAGFHGDRELGIRTLEMVAQKGDQNRYDAQIVLAVIYRRERHAQKAIPLLENLIQRYPRNYLFRFELVQMFADLGKKDEALVVLETLEDLQRRKVAGMQRLALEKIYYMRGNLLFWYREYDSALGMLSKVTPKASQLDVNTGMNAWLRTGQCLDMKGQRAKALDAYRQAIIGSPDSDAAKEAKRYLSSPYRRTGN